MEQERLGEINNNDFGTPMKIIKYKTSGDIDVEFLDDYHYVKQHTTYVNFKRGNIRNPFDPNTYGIGYTGDGKYLTRKNKIPLPQYVVWMHMLERCYHHKTSLKYPAYYGIAEVCKEWLNFQNFSKWFEDNKYDIGDERLNIDKDILYPGNKLYSPYHCILVPQSINEQFKEHSGREKKVDSDLPFTIRRAENKYTVSHRSKHLGTYDTVDECISVYKEARKQYVLELVYMYSDTMPTDIAKAIVNAAQ